jgi:Pyrroline-5-carboxylate reductase dimerisation
MADPGVLAGLPRDDAETLAFQTLLGFSRLLVDGSDSPAALRAAVTSPGGTTTAGLREPEPHRVRAAFLDAVMADAERSRDLGGQRAAGFLGRALTMTWCESASLDATTPRPYSPAADTADQCCSSSRSGHLLADLRGARIQREAAVGRAEDFRRITSQLGVSCTRGPALRARRRGPRRLGAGRGSGVRGLRPDRGRLGEPEAPPDLRGRRVLRLEPQPPHDCPPARRLDARSGVATSSGARARSLSGQGRVGAGSCCSRSSGGTAITTRCG